MNVFKYYLADSRDCRQRPLQSLVIDWLRFPLALAVVFIHAFVQDDMDITRLHESPLTLESIYDFTRILLTRQGMAFAVPAFFMISGFLFFYKTHDFTFDTYLSKLRRRIRTLLVPYLLWNALWLLFAEGKLLLGVLVNGNPLVSMWEQNGQYALWNNNVWHVALRTPLLLPLWFLRDLMVVALCSPLIHWAVRKGGAWAVALLGICFVTGACPQVDGLSITPFFWFTAGAYFSILGKDMVESLYHWRKPACVASVALLLALGWTHGGDNAYDLRPLYIIASIVSVVSLGAYLVRTGKAKVYPRLAKASFFVYLFHPFVIFAMPSSLQQAYAVLRGHTLLSLLLYLVMPFVTMAVCLYAYYLLDRHLPSLLSLLTGSRKER